MAIVVPETSFIPLDRAFGRDGVLAEMAPGIKSPAGFAVQPDDLRSGHALALVLGPDGAVDQGFAGDQGLVFLDRVLDPLNLRLDQRLGLHSDGRLLVATSMRALLGLPSTTKLSALRLTIGADQGSSRRASD